jgi:tape measure domain-containing protein
MASRLATAYMAIRADKQLFAKDLEDIKTMASNRLKGLKAKIEAKLDVKTLSTDISLLRKALQAKSLSIQVDAHISRASVTAAAQGLKAALNARLASGVQVSVRLNVAALRQQLRALRAAFNAAKFGIPVHFTNTSAGSSIRALRSWFRQHPIVVAIQLDPASVQRAARMLQAALQLAAGGINLNPPSAGGGTGSKRHGMLSLGRISEVATGILMAETVRHIGDAVGFMAKEMVSGNAQIEQFKSSLRIMIGDGKAATKMFSDLRQFALETAFELPDAMKAGQRLLRAGFGQEEIIPLLRDIGDAAAVSPDGLAFAVERISYALSQMHNAAKVNAQDMRQLTEAGIPAWQFLAESQGTDVATVTKMASSGQISGKEGVQAIRAGIQRNYGGAQEQWAGTVQGQWSILKEQLGRAMQQIGEGPFEGVRIAIKDMIDWTGSEEGQATIASLAETMKTLTDGALAAFSAVKQLVTGVGDFLSGIGDIVSAMLGPLANSLGSISWWFRGIIDVVHVLGLGLEFLGVSLKMLSGDFEGGAKAYKEWKKRAMGEMPSEKMDRLKRERDAKKEQEKKEQEKNRNKPKLTVTPKSVVGTEMAAWRKQQQAMYGTASTAQEQRAQASEREGFTKELLKTYDQLEDKGNPDEVSRLREKLAKMSAAGMDAQQYNEQSGIINLIEQKTKINNATEAIQNFNDKIRDTKIEIFAATDGQKMLAEAIAKGVPPDAVARIKALADSYDALKRVSEIAEEFKGLQDEMRKVQRTANERFRAQSIREDMRAAGYSEGQIEGTIAKGKALRTEAEGWKAIGEAFKDNLTPLEQFQRQVQSLGYLLSKNKITVDDYKDAVAALQKEIAKSYKEDARTGIGKYLERKRELDQLVKPAPGQKEGAISKDEYGRLLRKAKDEAFGGTVQGVMSDYNSNAAELRKLVVGKNGITQEEYEREARRLSDERAEKIQISRQGRWFSRPEAEVNAEYDKKMAELRSRVAKPGSLSPDEYNRAMLALMDERDKRLQEVYPRQQADTEYIAEANRLKDLRDRKRLSQSNYEEGLSQAWQTRQAKIAQAEGRGSKPEMVGLAEAVTQTRLAILGGKDQMQQKMLDAAKMSADANAKTAESVGKMQRDGIKVNVPAKAG